MRRFVRDTNSTRCHSLVVPDVFAMHSLCERKYHCKITAEIQKCQWQNWLGINLSGPQKAADCRDYQSEWFCNTHVPMFCVLRDNGERGVMVHSHLELTTRLRLPLCSRMGCDPFLRLRLPSYPPIEKNRIRLINLSCKRTLSFAVYTICIFYTTGLRTSCLIKQQCAISLLKPRGPRWNYMKLIKDEKLINTKKHSSRMRTARFPSSGGSLPTPSLQVDSPWMQTPLLDGDPPGHVMHAGKQTPPPPLWTEWQTRVKTLPCIKKMCNLWFYMQMMKWVKDVREKKETTWVFLNYWIQCQKGSGLDSRTSRIKQPNILPLCHQVTSTRKDL